MTIRKMIQTGITTLVLALALVTPSVLGGAVAGAVATPATPKGEVCKGVSSIGGGNACTDSSRGGQLGTFIGNIINILLFVVGAVAVIMIVIGGIRYVTSGGDQNGVTGAKNTILYAVVGLIVAVMAFAIVNFVLNGLK